MHFTIPAGTNEALLVPAIDQLVPAAAANRTRLDAAGASVGAVPLAELRAGLRAHVLALAKRDPDDERPIIASGHQPGLPHPGILYKHAVLEHVAPDAVCINVVVDSDTAETVSAKVPTRRDGASTVVEVVLARCERRVVLGQAPKPERRAFEAQLSEVRRAAAKLDNDDILNALDRFAALHREEYAAHDSLGELLTAYRRRYFPTPHVHEVFLSSLCRTDEFRAFAAAVIEQASSFLTLHNDTLAEHRRERRIRTRVNPFPDLRAQGGRTEVPFWHIDDDGRRSPLYVERAGERTTLYAYDNAVGRFAKRAQLDRLLARTQLVPRAITLTLFLRLCATDLFIHGVSGANYDAATDALVRNWLGIEPPVYCAASMTMRLPLEFDDGLNGKWRELRTRVRRMTWNPDEFAAPSEPLRVEKRKILAAAGPHLSRAEHERIETVRRRLLETIAGQREAAAAQLAATAEALAIHRRLGARDFPYFLFPLPGLQAAMAPQRSPCTG